MTQAPPTRGATAKAPAEPWKGRTIAVCGLGAAAAVGLAAANLDWSGDIAMSAGQLAGMTAPVAVIGLIVWLAAARTSHHR
jgi:hypothetical protein